MLIVLMLAYKMRLTRPRVLVAPMDVCCFYREMLDLERYICILQFVG